MSGTGRHGASDATGVRVTREKSDSRPFLARGSSINSRLFGTTFLFGAAASISIILIACTAPAMADATGAGGAGGSGFLGGAGGAPSSNPGGDDATFGGGGGSGGAHGGNDGGPGGTGGTGAGGAGGTAGAPDGTAGSDGTGDSGGGGGQGGSDGQAAGGALPAADTFGGAGGMGGAGVGLGGGGGGGWRRLRRRGPSHRRQFRDHPRRHGWCGRCVGSWRRRGGGRRWRWLIDAWHDPDQHRHDSGWRWRRGR